MKIELYTDGGCRGNGRNGADSGIGVVLLIKDKEPIYYSERLRFSPNTNNKAEIFAIIRGIQILNQNYSVINAFVKDELVIYSDSDYTIQGITKWIKGWKRNGWLTASKEPVKNQELWETLDNQLQQLNDNYEVTFIKVRGHAGVEYNTKCDKLANYAMDTFIPEGEFFTDQDFLDGVFDDYDG